MVEHPILFSGPMVRAILEGRKTQTRRVIKFPKHSPKNLMLDIIPGTPLKAWWAGRIKCPYGQPGDRLWVRETWAPAANCQEYPPDGPYPVIFKASDTPADFSVDGRWRPSIHMPRWACRLVLEVASVRVERLQDISEEDAKAEGVEMQSDRPCWVNYLDSDDWANTARESFSTLWGSVYGRALWYANPWVWVITFSKLGGKHGHDQRSRI